MAAMCVLLPLSYGASQLGQILIGVTMQTRSKQHHTESNQEFRGQAAHSPLIAKYSGPGAPRLKITYHAL